MDLGIKDVAKILNVSEETIEDLISKGDIPSYKLNQEYRFNRTEVEEWVMYNKNIPTSKNFKEDNFSGQDQFSLYRAINNGGLHYDIDGDNKEAVIKNSIDKVSANLNFDPESVSRLLLERENLMSTAINNGIAIPHTRDFLLNNHLNAIVVVFLKSPIEYGALDRKPVDTLFFLFASDDRQHLLLISKLAHICHDEKFLNLLKTRPERTILMKHLKEWEKNL